MYEESVSRLKERFAFDSWAGQVPDVPKVFLWSLTMSAFRLPGLRLHRVSEPLPLEGPRSSRSIWLSPDGNGEVTTVDAFECANVAEAHAWLIRTLADFQSPHLERLADAQGRLAFGVPGGSTIVFARGNVVVAVSTDGQKAESALALVELVDHELFDEPTADGAGELKAAVSSPRVRPGESIGLSIDAVGEDPTTFQLVTRQGEIRARGGALEYHAFREGGEEIRVFARRGTGRPAMARLNVEIS